MKPKLSILFLGLFLLNACFSPDPDYVYSNYHPVVMTRVQLEKSINWQSPREPLNPGKIYYKDNFIFINEKYKGVHVIDNTDPRSPRNVGFVQAPGNIDIAIKGKAMYLDNAVDLVTLDISNLQDVKVTERVPNVFPELPPPDDRAVPIKFTSPNRPENTVIVGWVKKE